MGILSELAVLGLLAFVIIISVRYLLIPGIDNLARVMALDAKARGQLLGYATSTPELVIILASAASGVFEAGFWNIASSNIINAVLFISAVLYWGQMRDLRKKPFRDELLFTVLSVMLPLLLFVFKVQGSVILAVGLLVVFGFYKFLDRRWNPVSKSKLKTNLPPGKVWLGVLSLLSAMVLIIAAGWKLGSVAEDLVVRLGLAPWIIGWILGFVSSTPEMSGFFEVYRKHKTRGSLKGLRDSQEALDSLVASNMSNVCIILPLGIFLLALL